MTSPTVLPVMALTISSLSAFCSRSLSLRFLSVSQPSPFSVSRVAGQVRHGDHPHRLVHLLGRQLPVYLLHGLAGPLHRRQRLPVDVR